jgi:hypothetical protein
MLKPLIRLAAAVAIIASASANAQSSPRAEPVSTGPVTVVVEVALAVNATPSEALVALNDIRAMLKKAAGVFV